MVYVAESDINRKSLMKSTIMQSLTRITAVVSETRNVKVLCRASLSVGQTLTHSFHTSYKPVVSRSKHSADFDNPHSYSINYYTLSIVATAELRVKYHPRHLNSN